MQSERTAAEEGAKYDAYMKFVSEHKNHNGYSLNLNIQSKDQYDRVAQAVEVSSD